jgi:putative membrane protein
MFVRSHLLPFAAAAILCGAAMAQPPGGAQGQPPPSQTPSQTGAPGSPGADRPGYAGATDTPSMADTVISDKAFVKKAAESSVTEVELGKLAQEKGSSEKVKEFGKRMVDDHQKSSEHLAAAATKVSVEVPTDLPRSGKKNRDKLAKLSGPDFDRAYAKLMVNDHKNDLQAFTQEAQAGRIPEVKEFAAKTLPTLQQHEKMAEDLQASVKK